MNLVTKDIFKDQLIGLEATRKGELEWTFNWVRLVRSKGLVRVRGQGSTSDTPGALVKEIGTRAPVALVILEHRASLKAVESGFLPERDLVKILPNAEAESLFTTCSEHGEYKLLSIARREWIMPLVNELAVGGVRLVDVFLGPGILKALPAQEDQDKAGVHSLHQIEDGGVVHQQLSEGPPMLIGEEVIDARCALAFAACWQSWFAPIEVQCTQLDCLMSARREERYRRIYERAVLGIFLMFLFLLGVDLGWRGYLRTGEQELHLAVATYKDDQERQARLEKAFNDRVVLARYVDAGCLGRMLRVVDDVGRCIPGNIKLDQLWYAPLIKEMKEGEPVELKTGVITITGHVTDIGVLPLWVSRLSDITGVEVARLISLDQYRGEGSATFNIEVELEWG